jgi:hypothetical protein
MQRGLVVLGVAIVLAGLAWPWLERLRLGRLPGDFVFHVGGVTIYLPLATMLLVSLVLSRAVRLRRH